MTDLIEADFPFAPHYANVNSNNMHYIDEGEGDPILFLHGVPTSSYLWRNIITGMKEVGRCIAVDLIGFGQSDKPDINYSVLEHIDYMSAFIERLDLRNITLVVHGWGSVVGFACFARFPERFKALAFVESHIRPASSRDMISLPVQELNTVLSGPDGGYDIIMNSNYYVNKVMPSGVLRKLSDEEMHYYSAPFQMPGSCQPIWQYLQELPMGDERTVATELIEQYSELLQAHPCPKLMFYAVPGYLTTIDTVIWARDSLPNLRLVDLGDGLHYPQESNPQLLATELKAWYSQLSTANASTA